MELKPIPQATRRIWFTAHMLVTWKDQHARRLRKAEKTGDEALIQALTELRPFLEGWIRAIDDVLA